MKPIVSVGEAHISSIVAAYDVGTLTSNVRPVARFSASAMISPPATMMLASTEGTNRTLMGCSGEPTAGSGTSVGGTAVGFGGGWVGACVAVAAGAHAARTMEAITRTAMDRYTVCLRMLLFPPQEIKIQ